MSSYRWLLGTAIIAILVMLRPAMGRAEPVDVQSVLDRLGIKSLPQSLVQDSPMSRALDELRREACDRRAIGNLSDELHKAGYRREAANALINFADSCHNGETLLNRAVGILFGISDYKGIVTLTSRLIEMSGDVADYRYGRGQALEAQGEYEAALADYSATVSLSRNIKSISSTVFRRMSNMHAKLGRYCQAITPLQMWVAADPDNRDTQQIRSMIAGYSAKGACETSYAKGGDQFPTQGGGAIRVRVKVNDVEGTFIVDTGASFVSLTRGFAERAGVAVEGARKVRLQTASGVSNGLLATAASIKVGKVRATDVTAVVHQEQSRPFGEKIDGLLGQSFLSRFDVTFGKHEWKVTPRSGSGLPVTGAAP